MKEKKIKSVPVKKRVKKTHAKAEFVGIVYLIATLLLAAAAFFPLLYGTSVGDMWVMNFWKPFLELKNVKGSMIPVILNVAVAAIYTVLLLTVVINVFKSLARLGRLFKAKASKVNGFNRNAIAMEEMGKIFSGTYCALIVFTFMIHLIAGAGFTNLYYIAIVVGLIIHFWMGLVGGNVSMFTVGKEPEEEKRVFGRLAPFFRNLAQLVFVGLIMYFISQTNLMMNATKWLEKGAFSTLFKGAKRDLVYYGLIPAVQLLMCIWTMVLLKHATASTEFHRDGKEASGMKNFRVFSILLLLTAGGLFGFMCFAATKLDVSAQMGTLFIAVIAFAALIEEFCMCRLPNVKGKVAETESENGDESEEVTADVTEESVQNVPPPVWQFPVQCINQPGIFMQPNGQPIMIMPMMMGPQATQMNAYANPYTYGQSNGYHPLNAYRYVPEVQETKTESKTEVVATTKKKGKKNKAQEVVEDPKEAERAALERSLAEKWMRMAREPITDSTAMVPYGGAGYVAPDYPVAPALTKEELAAPPVPKKWTVACPECGMQLTVKDDNAFAYRCPNCNGIFQLHKVYKDR